MSEPMTFVEIEDVLSSIRRLVSEDLRPTHKLVTAALQAGAAKLILTPALRVVSNDRAGFVQKADEPGDLQSLLQKIDVPDAADPVEILPMFGSVRLQEMADVRTDDVIGEDIDAATDANFLATAMSRINGLSVANMPLAAPAESIEAVVAAVGAAVGPDEWEVDGGDPAPQAKAWADTVWNSVDAPVAQAESDTEIPLLVSSDAVGLATDSAAAFDQVEVVDLGEVAEPVAQVVPTPAFDNDGGLAEGLMGQDKIVFHYETAPQPLPQPLPQVTEQVSAEVPLQEAKFAQDDLTDIDDGVSFLNEDLLRDIVRDMIKAELQGTLGERITRNVRKLVRAEINRALASRDYE